MTNSPLTVFLSDIHLSLAPKPEIEAALNVLFERHVAAHFVFVGDLFEFSSVDTEEPAHALAQLIAAAPDFVKSLRRHVERGGSATWIAGNHDAAVAELQSEVNEGFGFPVQVLPWFARFGDVHVEHGHAYDRDNAPLFPLGAWSAREEPVGIALMRRFVVRHELPDFAHAHQTTPIAGIKRALRLVGSRVPRLMLVYLKIAFGICKEAWRREPLNRSSSALTDAELARLSSSGVPSAELEHTVQVLQEERATPTHAALRSTFMRLYLDQLTAVGAVGLGGLGAAVGAVGLGWGGVGLGASYLLASRRMYPTSRYPGPEHALGAAARQLTTRLGVRHVIFGHSHVPEHTGSYLNLGSFGYGHSGRGRSYATLTADGQLSLEFLP